MAARQFESPIAAMVRYYELTLANSKRPTHKPMHPDQLDEWCLELEEVSASTCEICDRR